ncbi:Rhodanese-like domain-containing protein [Cladophialophora immunda]|nr:Rhodanese-like domain-containing protein [Cladophialophora immunda]
MPRLRQPKRHFTTTLVARKEEPSSSPSTSTSAPAAEPQSTLYTFADMQTLASRPAPNRVIVDVREPSELKATGKIPGAHNLPIKSAADGFFLGPEEFEERFGWEKPSPEDEVIFYCKAGVRSRAAARLAGQAAFGGKIGEFPGSWTEWAEKGGEVEKV